MKFDYLVKHNGVYYEIGADVPISEDTVSVENKVESSENSLGYKRSDIQKMKIEELKITATKLGITFDDETSGTQLKKDILIKLGV